MQQQQQGHQLTDSKVMQQQHLAWQLRQEATPNHDEHVHLFGCAQVNYHLW